MDQLEDFNPVDTSETLAKRDALGKTIQKRHEQVIQERERTVESRKENSLLVARILGELEAREGEIRLAIDEIAGSDLQPGLELTGHLDALEARFVSAEKQLSEQVGAVPQYDLRARQQALAALRDRFRQVQDQLQPKKRFGFKGSKKKVAAPVDSGETKKEDATEAAKSKSTGPVQIECSVSNRSDETIELSRGEVSGRDVLASGLTNCTLKVTGAASTLHLTGLRDCLVLCAPVATSVFVDDCRGCRFAVGCQQLRAHRTSFSDFYLHVTSGAIVEDCHGVRFAPFALTYDSLDADYASSGLDRSVNRYDKVQDFNWLAADKPSPNWTLLPETDRETFNM